MSRYDDKMIKRVLYGTNDYHETMKAIARDYLLVQEPEAPKGEYDDFLRQSWVKYHQLASFKTGLVTWADLMAELGYFTRHEASIYWRFGQIQKYPKRWLISREMERFTALFEALKFIVKNPREFMSEDIYEMSKAIKKEFGKRRISINDKMPCAWYVKDSGESVLNTKEWAILEDTIYPALTWVYYGENGLTRRDYKRLKSLIFTKS